MGERDGRRRVDFRAVRVGFGRFVVVTGGVFGVVTGLGFLFNPVLRQFAGSVRVPHGIVLLAFAAVVGACFGWSALRGGGRYVADTGPGTLHGSRALAVVAAQLDAAERDRRQRDRAAVHAAVRAWTPDLLRRVPDLEGAGPVIVDVAELQKQPGLHTAGETEGGAADGVR